MPRMPVYDSPQVEGTALTGGLRQETQTPFSAIAPALQQGIGIAGQMIQQANVTRVQDHENQLQSAKLGIDQWVQGLKGKNALDPTLYGGGDNQDQRSLEDTALGKFDEAARDAESGLSNDTQKQMFKQSAARFRLALQGQVAAHVAQQDEVYKADTFKSGQETILQDVGLNGYVNGRLDADGVAQNMERFKALNATYGANAGWDPATLEVSNKKAAAAVYGAVIDRMLEARNPEAAKTYFQDHQAEMDPALVGQIRQKVEATGEAVKVNADVATVRAMKGTDGNPLPLDQQFAKIQEMYAGNPHGEELATEKLLRVNSIEHTAKVQQVQTLSGKLTALRYPLTPGQQGMSQADIEASPMWQALKALDGTATLDLAKNWEAYDKRNLNDPYAMQRFSANFYDALRVQDANGQPAWLNYNKDQVHNLLPLIGPANASQLSGMIYEHQTTPPTAPKPVDVNKDLVESTLHAGGIIKNIGDKMTQDEKATVQDIDAKLRLESQSSGKPLSYADTVKRVQDLAKPIITKPENWFQRNLVPGNWDTTAPLFKVEQADPFPPNFYLQASDLLMQKGGSALDEANAQQAYLAYKNAGKLDPQGNIIGYVPNQDNLHQLLGTRAAAPRTKLPMPRKR